jgi:hypothetical protein
LGTDLLRIISWEEQEEEKEDLFVFNDTIGELTSAILMQMSGLSAFILRASAGAIICWGFEPDFPGGGEGVMGDAVTGGWILASSYLMLSGVYLNPKL